MLLPFQFIYQKPLKKIVFPLPRYFNWFLICSQLLSLKLLGSSIYLQYVFNWHKRAFFSKSRQHWMQTSRHFCSCLKHTCRGAPIFNFPLLSLLLSLHVCPNRELKPTQHWAPTKGSLTLRCIIYKNTCNSILRNPHKNQSKSDQYPGIGHGNRHSRICKKLVRIKWGDNRPTEGSIFLSSSACHNLLSEAQMFSSIKKGGTYQWTRSNPWVGINRSVLVTAKGCSSSRTGLATGNSYC